VTSLIEHRYAEEGEYRVSIYGDFPRFNFDKDNDAEKLVSISSWGDVVFDFMEGAFSSCSNLRILANDSLKTQGVTSLRESFKGVKYVGGSVGLMDVSGVLDMSYAFQGVSEMPAFLAGWDVSQVQNMEGMFLANSTFNGEIGAWNVKNVTNMRSMFEGAVSFDQNLGSWNVSNVANYSRMFNGAKLSVVNYDLLLVGWNKLPSVQQNLLFDVGKSQFCRGGSARTALMNNNGWTVIDYGDIENCCSSGSTEYNLGAWTYGVPSGNTLAIFNTDYDTSVQLGGIDACSVVINADKEVKITDGYFLNIGKELRVLGELMLKGGSFDFGN
jgi:hypothetical protein